VGGYARIAFIIVGTQVEAEHHVVLGILGRAEDDGDMPGGRSVLQPPCHLDALLECPVHLLAEDGKLMNVWGK
jgi:hypothetical protein